jgi:hypothetical protein
MVDEQQPEPAAETRSFFFWGCSEIRESLGLRADSERYLLERLEVAPSESIYHHTVRSLLRRQIFPMSYPDDFSSWVAAEIGDLALAEKLALHSPFDFEDVEDFRQQLLEILDDHLSDLRYDPRVGIGQPFYFQRGHLAAVPLDVGVTTLTEFRKRLAEVDESSIYFHAVEAIGRLGNPRGDFAAWVEDVLGYSDLGRQMSEIDPFVFSLARVRGRLLDLVDAALAGGAA